MMILPRLSANDGRIQAPTPQSDLTYWCEATVRDRLTTFYLVKMDDPAKASQAASLHWSIWRSYFNDLGHQSRASRQTLAKLLARFSLCKDVMDAGDDIVIDEIADLILQRFRRAPLHAKIYAKCLVTAATRMGQARN